MNFQRTYNILCLRDELYRNGLQNAIDAVNLACTSSVNAWAYVESREILNDYNNIIDPNDNMKNAIFNHIYTFGHSGGSISFTINNLVLIATNHTNWAKICEEENSIIEGEEQQLNYFRQNSLVPYYRSMSGGGFRNTAVGPIVSEFLELRNRLQFGWLPEVIRTFNEVRNLLGTTLEEQVKLLDDILTNSYNSTRLSNYRDSLKKQIEQKNMNKEYHDGLINAQIPILKAAIESRNPVALKAALNPGWSSCRFMELKEYQDAHTLLNELSSGVHVAENSS
jgi:hypothetical protein